MRNSAVKSTAMARPTTTTTVSTRTLLTSVCVGVCLFGIITSVHSGERKTAGYLCLVNPQYRANHRLVIKLLAVIVKREQINLVR